MRLPVPRPSKIICTGLNYHDHCIEIGIPVPTIPISFSKHVSAVIGPDEQISWPAAATEQVDYEVELAVVIGKEGASVSEEAAYDYVLGYTILNDISARDVQKAEKQWVRCKSFDTFCPIGPHVVTTDEIEDPHNLAIACRVNGKVMQQSSTREMIFKIPELIARFSQGVTLYPGDIISTGTPGGVGVFRNPPFFLKKGDTVECEIQGIGVLRNVIAGPY